MNRRELISTSFKTAVAASSLRMGQLVAQDGGTKTSSAGGETLHVHPVNGADTNSGSKASPLRTLAEAARRANLSGGNGPMTIVLSEGIHAVGETTTLKPERRSFSKTNRLTIRAEILPGDPEWNIGRMPALIHTMPVPATWNGRPDPLGGAANGMLIETSHVTVQGLKILGLPLVETPGTGQKRRLYAIARFDRSLDDLEVAQCLFASDEVVAPLHVGVIAHGNGVVIHHCLFRGYVKDAVVYWTPDSTGHALRNCFLHGMYSSSVWTAGIAAGFDYRNNVVDSANYVWIYQSGASSRADATGGRAQLTALRPEIRYRVVDSLFANNRKLAGTGTGARIEFADIDPSFLVLTATTVTDQPVVVGKDSTKRDYLHPAAGTEAAKIGAGLFMSSSA